MFSWNAESGTSIFWPLIGLRKEEIERVKVGREREVTDGEERVRKRHGQLRFTGVKSHCRAYLSESRESVHEI